MDIRSGELLAEFMEEYLQKELLKYIKGCA